MPNAEDKQNLGRLNKKTYHVSYLMMLGNMEIDCWRKRYKNTDETTCRFIVKNILSHVFSFFTLLPTKEKQSNSFKSEDNVRKGPDQKLETLPSFAFGFTWTTIYWN